jgi:hypothetical protein
MEDEGGKMKAEGGGRGKDEGGTIKAEAEGGELVNLPTAYCLLLTAYCSQLTISD